MEKLKKNRTIQTGKTKVQTKNSSAEQLERTMRMHIRVRNDKSGKTGFHIERLATKMQQDNSNFMVDW